MGKFLNIMSQNDSKALRQRAASLNTQAAIAQKNLINDLTDKKVGLELEVQSLTDFAPDSTQSLRPSVSNWNPKEWAKRLQVAKQNLYEVSIALKIAEDTYKEFFDEDDAAPAGPADEAIVTE